MGNRITVHIRTHIIGYLALVVALSGTAYAAAKINGRQIKQNSIPVNRLTKSARTSLQGQQGPPGQNGATNVVVIHIDHGLSPGSAQVASEVAAAGGARTSCATTCANWARSWFERASKSPSNSRSGTCSSCNKAVTRHLSSRVIALRR